MASDKLLQLAESMAAKQLAAGGAGEGYEAVMLYLHILQVSQQVSRMSFCPVNLCQRLFHREGEQVLILPESELNRCVLWLAGRSKERARRRWR